MKATRFLPAIGLAALAAFSGCPRPQVHALHANTDSAVVIRKALGAGKSGPATAAADIAQPTGWATIRGRFTLAGSPPARSPVSITKDPQVCAPGGRQVLSEEMVVGADGGIKDVVLYLVTKIPLDNAAFIHPD